MTGKNKKYPFHSAQGFTLVELMIALLIGLIATIGMISLFSGTSKTNAFQDALARLQENGRYATLRIENDLRMAAAQYCTAYEGTMFPNTVTPMAPERPPFVYAANLNLPDSGGMRRVDPAGNASTVDATASYALSQRFFMQGHSCSGTTCTPAQPASFPSAGLSAGSRVPSSDILTIRYQRGTGWPVTGAAAACASNGTLQITPQPGDDPVNFAPGPQLAYLSECRSPSIIPITAVSGNTLTLGTILPGAQPPECGYTADGDKRLFNFSQDFVTVTYYLAFRADDNPDARPNSGSNRLVPALIRRENGVEQELVRGVDRLDFRYGVRDNLGNLRFLTAAQVDNNMGGTITCTTKTEAVPPVNAAILNEPKCLWRAVQRVEAHLLVGPGQEVPSMDSFGRAYRYLDVDYSPAENTPMASGILTMNVPRREFIAHAANRNRVF